MSLVEDAMRKLRAAGSGPLATTAGPGSALTSVSERAAVPESLPDTLVEEAGPPPPRAPLDRNAMAEAGYDVLSPATPGLVSQMRAIKRQVLELVGGVLRSGRAPVIAVTSAVPGDGKSFVSLNLSVALAMERDIQVTLVDYDNFRRRTSALFGVSDASGMIEYVTAGARGTLATLQRETDIPRLTMIPAGRPQVDAPEQLTSSGFDTMLEKMRRSGRTRCFVFDSPPVLATATAAFLAKRADLTVFVVRERHTPTEALREAMSRLGSGPMIAMVLNGHIGSIADRYYGYTEAGSDYASQ